jgi:integrase
MTKEETMKGSVRRRPSGAFAIILELGRETDPVTGKRRRVQRWVTFHPSPALGPREQKQQADAKLVELLGQVNAGTFAEPSKITLIEWLRSWLQQSVAPPMRQPATYELYRGIIERHLAPSTLAHIPIQRLRRPHIEHYLRRVRPGSLSIHRAILHRALKMAVRDNLLPPGSNPASGVEVPCPEVDASAVAKEQCWSVDEMQSVIATADAAGPQMAAFIRLALDSGARKSELYGLGWQHLNVEASRLRIDRQLYKANVEPPVFGPLKTHRKKKGGKSRTLDLGPDTIAALRVHRQHQLELRLKNGVHYHNHNMIFAKEPEDLQTPGAALGQAINTLGGRRFERLVKRAGVKRIKFHGCRHTVATLLLMADVPPHVVAERMGHSTEMLLTTYAHVTPRAQHDAAARLSNFVRGGAGHALLTTSSK